MDKKFEKKGAHFFRFSMLALALGMAGNAVAEDYYLYRGITKNIERNKAYVTQEEYNSKSYQYPRDSTFGSVSFLAQNDEGINHHSNINYPTESIVSIGHGDYSPQALEVATNTNFILDKTFAGSSVFDVSSGGKLKFHNGSASLGYAFLHHDEFDNALGAFDVQGGEIDVDNVRVFSADNLNSEAMAYLLAAGSTAKVTNSSINITHGNNIQTGFDATKSDLQTDNVSIQLKGGVSSTAYLLDSMNANISNNHIQVDGKKGEYNSAVFRVMDSTVNITNSTLNAGNDVINFGVLGAEYDEGLVNNKTVINFKDSSIESAGKGFIVLNDFPEDDETAVDNRYKLPFIFNSDHSTLRGVVNQANSNRVTPVSLNLNNGSSWFVTGDSNVTNLNNNNSVVDLRSAQAGKFTTLTLGNLTGNGTFVLNTDLANEKSDQIVVNGKAEGSHKLDVKDSGNEPKAPNGKVTLVKTQAGEAKFSLLNRDYVDAGAYRYRLHQQGYDWILSNNANEKSEKPAVQPTPIAPVNPTTPTDTTKPVEPTKPAKPVTPTETVQPSEPAKPVVPAETVKPAEPAKPVVPAETVKPAEPAKPVVPAETVKPAEPVKPIAPTETEKLAEPVKPVAPTETTKPDTATTTPVAPVMPQPTPTQPDDHPAVQKMLSETSNTLVSLRQAQLQLTELELSGIHQRLGELKTAETGNVWVRNHNARQERKAQSVSADSIASGFKQDTTLLQIGADTAISDNWRAGGFVGTSRSDIDFNGEYGKGKLKGINLGLYATFQAQNGIYADNIVKFDRLRTSGDGVANQSYNGYTISSEIGKAFAFGEGWTVTPQAQLAWTHLSSGDNVESLSALTSRAGVRVSKAIALANGNITPFIEVNGIHTHNRHSQVRVNQYAFDVKGAGSRIETAAGVSASFANHRLGVQLSTAHGSHLKQPLAVQVNYRYSW